MGEDYDVKELDTAVASPAQRAASAVGVIIRQPGLKKKTKIGSERTGELLAKETVVEREQYGGHGDAERMERRSLSRLPRPRRSLRKRS